jgi:hypothetical protein
MRFLQAREVAALPSLAPAEEILADTVSVHGQVAVLAAARIPPSTTPAAGSSAPATVYLHDDGWLAVTLDQFALPYPHVDLLPDGDLLIVGARSQRYRDGSIDDNAHIFDSSGIHRSAFCLGDGIEHLGVDHCSSIWVAYFDEGVFGSHGWTQPVGAAGLVRFSRHGDRLWAYIPPSGAAGIADCYALNVDARTTWIYYYTDFPLVQITDNRARAYAPTPVRGARAVVVYDHDVVFIGEYNDPLRLSSCRLTRDTIEYRGQATIIGPDGAPLTLFRLVAARGSRLYLRTDTHIILVDIADDPNRTG